MKKSDRIRINEGRFSKSLEATLTILSFIDKDTEQYIMYIPSLDFSSYGKTQDKAQQMFDLSLKDELARILAMGDKQAKDYLRSFGWKIEPLHNKNLSHVAIDKNGALQGFNVDLDSVKEEKVSLKEQLELT